MSEKKIPYRGLYEWMQTIVVTFLLVLFLLLFIGRNIGVEQQSMTPTLLDGDRMIVRSILYTPSRGDIVIFAKQDFEEGTAMVKRVIGTAGDEIDIDTTSGIVYLNGAPLDEPFVNDLTFFAGDTIYPYIVPAGHVFVMGDNRNHSNDSRSTAIGSVDTREIIGQAIAVFFPFDRIGLLR